MNRQVFINCPFTYDYQDFFYAICFTIIRSGYEPRCALEADDSSEIRIEKICKIIAACRFGIHDISKTEPDGGSGLPRFNMPLELGLFLGAKKFGPKTQKEKKCIIFDREQHRYQKFISDIAGQDIHHHDGKPEKLIGRLASWLRDETDDKKIPGGKAIAAEFGRFSSDIPAICELHHLDPAEVTFQDFVGLATNWILADGAAKR
jgi:hypothetical protein